MALIRVPYPEDPAEQVSLFHRAAAVLARHGGYEGNHESGTFHGQTPIGSFAGRYQSRPGSDTLEIELTKKPFLVPVSVVEHHVRRFLDQVR
jgi:hypothetical protein